MSLLDPATHKPQNTFWAGFEAVIPEAVRCRFFSTARQAAIGRAISFDSESGPFLEAIAESHLPVALIRLRLLAKVSEAITAFFRETDTLTEVTTAPLFEVTKIVAAFEEALVVPLQDALQQNSEEKARQLIPKLVQEAVDIAQTAERYFNAAIQDLETSVAKSVIRSEPFGNSVSVVSLDMAQYGKHAQIVSNYNEAEGVHSFNKKIRQKINESIALLAIPSKDVLVINTGDGALIIFSTDTGEPKTHVEHALKFSEQFLKFIHEGNERLESQNQLHFRVGVCTGIIAGFHHRVRTTDITHCDAGGLPLGTAVRLQAAAKTGEIVVSASTYAQAGPGIRGKFGSQESVFGKTHEKNAIPAHRYQCVPPIADERG